MNIYNQHFRYVTLRLVAKDIKVPLELLNLKSADDRSRPCSSGSAAIEQPCIKASDLNRHTLTWAMSLFFADEGP
jgi:hypothetical protein